MSRDTLDVFLKDLEVDWESDSEASRRPRIVVVDDDPSMREALAFIFQDDYDVCVCNSAEEGVAAVTDETAAVILDVKMQGHDGFWACTQIRARQPLLPVIFCSAYQDVKNPYEIINDYQPFGYVIKGDDMDDLIAMVGRAVHYSRLVRRNKKLIDRLDQAQRDVRKRREESSS